MSRISIIVPVYYNSDTLMDLYDDMKAKVLDRIGDYEIVFVDDGSGDRCRALENRSAPGVLGGGRHAAH